jgi:hypothetical protein
MSADRLLLYACLTTSTSPILLPQLLKATSLILCLPLLLRSGMYPSRTVSFSLPHGRSCGVYLSPDILQDACKISRKTDQTPARRIIPENATTTPLTPALKTGLASTSAPMNGERRKISVREAVKLVKEKSMSSSKLLLSSILPLHSLNPYPFLAAQNVPLESPIARDDQQTAGLSMPPPSTPAQGIKRTSSGVCTSAQSIFSIFYSCTVQFAVGMSRTYPGPLRRLRNW